MMKLAITGGIGSGKSVVSRIMEITGVPVYDCDSRAKYLMVKDSSIIKSLKRMFGEECYREDGSLNRRYIASCIFTNKSNIDRINALVHPVVKRDFEEWAASQECDVVAVETAILYESGMIESVDKVLVVWTDKETAISRTMSKNGMSRLQVEDRMNNQMTVDELLLLSDYSIFNDGCSPILPQVLDLLAHLKRALNFVETK